MLSLPFRSFSPSALIGRAALYAWTWLLGALLILTGDELLQPYLRPTAPAAQWAIAPIPIVSVEPADAGPALAAVVVPELQVAPQPGAAPAPPPWLPITYLRASTIGLDVEVVAAPFVEVNGGGTWRIPPFRPGHAEHSAGAGAAGNAILFGHVVHPSEGAIFKDVPHLQVGHLLEAFNEDTPFRYTVTQVLRVSRTDVWVLEPGETPTLTLITCTGAWLPHLQDFAERLVVRAELRSATALAAQPPGW